MPAVVCAADTGNQDRSTETEMVSKRNRVCRLTPNRFQDSLKSMAVRREGRRSEAQQTGHREETARPRPTRTSRHLNPISLSQLEPHAHCRHLGQESLPRPRSRQMVRHENHFSILGRGGQAGQKLTRVTRTQDPHATPPSSLRRGNGQEARAYEQPGNTAPGSALPGGT